MVAQKNGQGSAGQVIMGGNHSTDFSSPSRGQKRTRRYFFHVFRFSYQAQRRLDAMVGRFEDPDEKVRVAICKVIGSLDYETALHHVRAKTLQVAGGRMLDKKVSKPYKKE